MRKSLPSEFDEFAKRRFKKLVDEKKLDDVFVVAGFIDYFGDGKIGICSDCGVPVWVRPWLMEEIEKHGLKIVCIFCADPLSVKGQIVMDLAKIQVETGL